MAQILKNITNFYNTTQAIKSVLPNFAGELENSVVIDDSKQILISNIVAGEPFVSLGERISSGYFKFLDGYIKCWFILSSNYTPLNPPSKEFIMDCDHTKAICGHISSGPKYIKVVNDISLLGYGNFFYWTTCAWDLPGSNKLTDAFFFFNFTLQEPNQNTNTDNGSDNPTNSPNVNCNPNLNIPCPGSTIGSNLLVLIVLIILAI